MIEYPDDSIRDRVISFASETDYIVRFYDNGEMQINEKYTTTEAAKAFWEIVKGQASSATPADIRKAALAAYDAPIHQDASLNSLVNKESQEFVLEVIERAIFAERQAERERCNAIVREAFGKNVSIAALDALAKCDAIVAKHTREEA